MDSFESEPSRSDVISTVAVIYCRSVPASSKIAQQPVS